MRETERVLSVCERPTISRRCARPGRRAFAATGDAGGPGAGQGRQRVQGARRRRTMHELCETAARDGRGGAAEGLERTKTGRGVSHLLQNLK
ncbi:hypothetical protein DM50_3464 [Burkholderia mallei]|nr:hypothetical protein BUC_6781 [Burkholderia pseudomallei 576]KOS84937.1 hypothetical protein DM53_2572 [Burkholderia mallei]KOS97151.1 hypothetical protein DM50_3464 [Burkholderia mallei]